MNKEIESLKKEKEFNQEKNGSQFVEYQRQVQ
jgi:hypothetical protein